MPDLFKDREHLVRMAGLFAVGVFVFLLLRGILIPGDFGVYGPFRAGALDDNRSTPLRYAGRESCETCHDDVAEERAGGPHEAVGCETCHGPLARHAESPDLVVPEAPEVTPLCISCHRLEVARPASFPQVDIREHAEGAACDDCHLPHNPL